MGKIEVERSYTIGQIQQALKAINEYLVFYGPDKELEKIRNYLFSKVWKNKGWNMGRLKEHSDELIVLEKIKDKLEAELRVNKCLLRVYEKFPDNQKIRNIDELMVEIEQLKLIIEVVQKRIEKPK